MKVNGLHGTPLEALLPPYGGGPGRGLYGGGSVRGLLFFLCILLFASCDDRGGSLLPPSGGKLFETLLVGDSNDIVRNALQTDMPGLPQSEPQWDVSSVDSSAFGSSLKVTRNIVIVRTSPALYSTVRIRYERNVWAEPQMVITLTAPTAKVINDSINRVAPTLLRLLNRSEMGKTLSLLRTQRNIKAERMVDSIFHIHMWIPLDMTASRKGKDFLWLSNNSPTIMNNIVIYRTPVHDNFIASRDSALGLNIKGETDRMQMATVAQTVMQNENGSFYRGLWEMQGDNMGGPFISRRIKTADGKGELNIEGFVFAPGKAKRNPIRQLEAVLYSVNRKLTAQQTGQKIGQKNVQKNKQENKR